MFRKHKKIKNILGLLVIMTTVLLITYNNDIIHRYFLIILYNVSNYLNNLI